MRLNYHKKYSYFLRVFSFVLVLLLGASIQVMDFKKVDPQKYLEIYTQNRAQTTKSELVDNIQYKIQYVPLELKLIQLHKKGAMSESVYDQYQFDKKKYVEFLFQISIPEFGGEFLKYESNETSYNQRLDYYSFNLKDDIRIVLDKSDTVLCSEFIFERNFGSSPNGSFILGANISNKYKQLTVIINDRVLTSQELKFNFSYQDFKKLPSLKKYNKWKK